MKLTLVFLTLSAVATISSATLGLLRGRRCNSGCSGGGTGVGLEIDIGRRSGLARGSRGVGLSIGLGGGHLGGLRGSRGSGRIGNGSSGGVIIGGGNGGRGGYDGSDDSGSGSRGGRGGRGGNGGNGGRGGRGSYGAKSGSEASSTGHLDGYKNDVDSSRNSGSNYNDNSQALRGYDNSGSSFSNESGRLSSQKELRPDGTFTDNLDTSNDKSAGSNFRNTGMDSLNSQRSGSAFDNNALKSSKSGYNADYNNQARSNSEAYGNNY